MGTVPVDIPPVEATARPARQPTLPFKKMEIVPVATQLVVTIAWQVAMRSMLCPKWVDAQVATQRVVATV
jgi:hypothetical protein